MAGGAAAPDHDVGSSEEKASPPEEAADCAPAGRALGGAGRGAGLVAGGLGDDAEGIERRSESKSYELGARCAVSPWAEPRGLPAAGWPLAG